MRKDTFALLGARAWKIESTYRENPEGKILKRLRLDMRYNAVAAAA